MVNNPHKGHRERVKRRFETEGLDHFEAHNVLELLLFYSIPQKDTNPIAHALINRFGSVSGVLDAPPEQLLEVPGVTPNSVGLLKLIPQLCRRYYQEKADIRLPEDKDILERIGTRLVAACIGRTVETAFLLCYDNAMKELFFDIISEGTADTVMLLCRRVVEVAIRVNASAVIIAHNHPGGFAIPSQADVSMTHQLSKLLGGISIRLLDHIIVAGDDFVSMAQSGVFARDFFPGEE